MNSRQLKKRSVMLLLVLAAIVTTTVITTTTARAAESAISTRYKTDTAVAKMLGAPTGQEFKVGNGAQRNYAWGSLYWSPTTGVYEVHGAIWWKYKSLGGPAGFLGFPKTDESQIINNIHGGLYPLGAASTFQNGDIVWSNGALSGGKTGAVWIGPAIAKLWDRFAFPYYGMPSSDQKPIPGKPNAYSAEFGTSNFYSSLKTGTHAVVTGDALVRSHDTMTKYQQTGGAGGFLGLPTSPGFPSGIDAPSTGHPFGFVQTFEWGAIYAPGGGDFSGAHEVHGAIWWSYSHSDGLNKLGHPTSDEQSIPGGRISYFEKGSISWNAATNKTTTVINP